MAFRFNRLVGVLTARGAGEVPLPVQLSVTGWQQYKGSAYQSNYIEGNTGKVGGWVGSEDPLVFTSAQNNALEQPAKNASNVEFSGGEHLDWGKIDISNNCTVSIRFRMPSPTGFPAILSSKFAFNDSDGFYISYDTGSTEIDVRGSSGTQVSYSPTNIANFTTITAVFSGTNVDIYENGIFATSGTIAQVAQSTQNTLIGTKGDGGGQLIGDIEYITEYSTNLTAQNVLDLHNFHEAIT